MPVLFKLRPSRIFSAVLFCAYALAILIVLMLPLLFIAKVMLAVLLIGALVYYLRRDAWLLSPLSTVAIRMESAEITLFDRAGCPLSGQLSDSSVVSPAMTILNVYSEGNKHTRSLVIFPDSMDKEQFRELRVLLKWRRSNK